MKEYHCCISLDMLLKLTLEGEHVLVDAGTGDPLQEREVYDMVAELRRDGATVLTPGCDNCDSDGKCMGHEVK